MKEPCFFTRACNLLEMYFAVKSKQLMMFGEGTK